METKLRPLWAYIYIMVLSSQPNCAVLETKAGSKLSTLQWAFFRPDPILGLSYF